MSSSRAGRKKARGAEATDASGVPQKPKKVNSEIRKQQNRIASRNYRTYPYAFLPFKLEDLMYLNYRREKETKAAISPAVASGSDFTGPTNSHDSRIKPRG